MPSPFPGMDPYLEGRNTWLDVHNALIVAIRDALAPRVEPDYYVAIEERAYIVEMDGAEFIGRPDLAVITAPSEAEPTGLPGAAISGGAQTVTLPLFEEVRESYLEIHDVQTHEVITVIEVLSRTNKVPGEGRREYEAKRRQVPPTLTNYLEIDLLRTGAAMEIKPPPRSDYRILVRAGWESPHARLYAFSVRQPIPEASVPLREEEGEAQLALGKLLREVYDRARYGIRLDYRQPPEPPLTPDDASWADELLRLKRLRG